MPAVIAAIGVWVISSVIAKVFIALGIGLFSYYGLYALVEQLLNQVSSLLNGLPAEVFQLISLAGIPEALSIIGSAVLTRAALNSVQVFFGVRA